MTFLTPMERVRPWLLKKVEESNATVAFVQQALGVTPDRSKGYAALTLYFKIVSELGNELGFVVLLAGLAWLGTPSLLVHVVCLFTLTFHIGQVLKESFRLPRPSKPVLQLHNLHELDFGLPSTHAMASASLPMYLFLVAWSQGTCSIYSGVIPLFVWASVSLSRLYLGAHSVPDVVVGTILGYSILLLYVGFDMPGRIDHWLVASDTWAIELLAATALLIYIHPKLDEWSPSYGDTATFLSVYLGVITGIQAGINIVPIPPTPIQAGIPLLSHDGMAIIVKRLVLGYSSLGLIRIVAKTLGISLMVSLLPPSDINPKHRYAVEIPVK
eukprot:Ihof_evm24s20 gene=Ihof_evmTU24s20